jgi:hypothetical protein
MGHLIALNYKSVQVEPSQDMEKEEYSPRDMLIYWDIPGYTVIMISKDILVYTRIPEYTIAYNKMCQDIL